MTYTELHCHSAYSFLDGASLPEELAAAALELGHRALALTDHDGVYGSMEFAHAARAIGLRPIQASAACSRSPTPTPASACASPRRPPSRCRRSARTPRASTA